MERAGHILILTGPPGSGKTTTSRLLASQPGSPKVHLHADDFWHFIKNGSIPPYLPAAHDQNRVVMTVLANAADTYAAGGYLAIVDGIIGPWFLTCFQALDRPVHYVVLRPPLHIAIQRCCDRGGETLSDAAVIKSLHEQFSQLGSLESHVIVTKGHGPDQTLDEVTGALLSGRHLLQR